MMLVAELVPNNEPFALFGKMLWIQEPMNAEPSIRTLDPLNQ